MNTTPLRLAFMSLQNIQKVQLGIQQYIYQKSGYMTDIQDQTSVGVLMDDVYKSTQKDEYNDIDSQVQNMNSITIERAYSRMLPYLNMHVYYLKNYGKIPPQPVLPQNVSTTGLRFFAP